MKICCTASNPSYLFCIYLKYIHTASAGIHIATPSHLHSRKRASDSRYHSAQGQPSCFSRARSLWAGTNLFRRVCQVCVGTPARASLPSAGNLWPWRDSLCLSLFSLSAEVVGTIARGFGYWRLLDDGALECIGMRGRGFLFSRDARGFRGSVERERGI